MKKEEMTLETMSMAELRALAEQSAIEWNEAYGASNLEKIVALDRLLGEITDEYTAKARKECFAELAACDDPMYEACSRLTFKSIRARDIKTNDENKVPVKTIEDVDKPINLVALHKSIKGGIGANTAWVFEVEKLNYLMTMQSMKDLGILDKKALEEKYAISNGGMAAEIDEPSSKTKLTKALTQILQSMLGEGYSAISYDAAFLLKVYEKKDNRTPLAVVTSNHTQLTRIMAELAHKKIANANFTVRYKEKKAK